MRLLIVTMACLLSIVAVGQEVLEQMEPETAQPMNANAPVVAQDTVTFITAGEQSAEFPGGFSAMMDYLRDHIHYPEEEQEDRIEGKVILQFVVRRDGLVDDVQVLRGVAGGMGLEREAVRVVKAMPLWTPAMNNGVTVNSRVTVPIMFKLTN